MSKQNGKEPDEAEPTKTGVVDEENYSHSRRQQLIEDTRERAVEVRTEARSQMISGQLSRRDARQHYRGAVESYLLQVVPLLRQEQADADFETDYLEEAEIGTITFEPPSELKQFARDNIIRLANGSKVPTERTVAVRGLETVLSLPSPISQTWSVVVDKAGGPDKRVARTTKELPLSLLDEVMQTTDKALSEFDIGIKLDEKEQQTKITKELLKEVDEWRQQNLDQ